MADQNQAKPNPLSVAIPPTAIGGGLPSGGSGGTPRTPGGADRDFSLLADGLSELSAVSGSEELALPNLSAERDVIVGMRTADPTTFNRLLAMTDPILSPSAVLKKSSAASAGGGGGGGGGAGPFAFPSGDADGGDDPTTPIRGDHHRRTSSGAVSSAVAAANALLRTPPPPTTTNGEASDVVSPFTFSQQQQMLALSKPSASPTANRSSTLPAALTPAQLAAAAAANGGGSGGAATATGSSPGLPLHPVAVGASVTGLEGLDQTTALKLRLAMGDADRAVLEDELTYNIATAQEMRRRYTLLNTRTAAVMQHNYSLQQMNASYSSQITELRSHSEALTAALSALSAQRRGSGSGPAGGSTSGSGSHNASGSGSSPSVDAALAVAASTANALQMRSKIDEHEMAALKLKLTQAQTQAERSNELEKKLIAAKTLEERNKKELDALLKVQLKYAQTQYVT